MLLYPFKNKPFKHQLDCFLIEKDRHAFAYILEMGLGKSFCLINCTAYNYDQGRVNGLVVLAPKGVYTNWVDSELPRHMPDHIRYKVGIWDATPNRTQQAALDALGKAGDEDLHILVQNIESLATKRGVDCLKSFLLGHNAMMAVDESTTIQNSQAIRTKAVIKLGRLAKMRRILSGQPAPNGPLGLYAQFAFLDPEFLGFDSFFSFKAQFAQCVPMKTSNGRTFQKVVGYRNAPELNLIMGKHSFIVKKVDCLDLPPKTYQTRYVEMGAKQKAAYDQMQRLCFVELETAFAASSIPEARPTGEETPPVFSTAKLVITQLLRLHQILCGFVVTDDKQVVPFDEPNPRMEGLMDAVQECAGKVIIWATYRFSVAQIAARLAKEYGPESVVTYYGPTSVDDRRAAIAEFQDPASPVRFFVANRTGARGITLTASSTALYFSSDYDLDVRSQSEDRQHRIGQLNPCTYVDFCVRDTQDEKITKALQGKISLAEIITKSNWKTFFR